MKIIFFEKQMTAISSSSPQSSLTCSFLRYSSPKKLTRLFWTLSITIFICFWTFLLYCYTSNAAGGGSLLLKTGKYSSPIAFSTQQQQQNSQKSFDLLIKSKISI
jgi:hypothetical protein